MALNGAAPERHDHAHAPCRPRHLHTPEEPRRELSRDLPSGCAWRVCDHLHTGTVQSASSKATRMTVQRLLRHVCATATRQCRTCRAASTSTRTGPRSEEGHAGGFGRHPRRPDAPADRPTSATTWCCSSAVARSATRQGIQAGAVANRVALECDREGAQRRTRHQERRPRDPARRRLKFCTPLKAGARNLEGRCQLQLRPPPTPADFVAT